MRATSCCLRGLVFGVSVVVCALGFALTGFADLLLLWVHVGVAFYNWAKTGDSAGDEQRERRPDLPGPPPLTPTEITAHPSAQKRRVRPSKTPVSTRSLARPAKRTAPAHAVRGPHVRIEPLQPHRPAAPDLQVRPLSRRSRFASSMPLPFVKCSLRCNWMFSTQLPTRCFYPPFHPLTALAL